MGKPVESVSVVMVSYGEELQKFSPERLPTPLPDIFGIYIYQAQLNIEALRSLSFTAAPIPSSGSVSA